MKKICILLSVFIVLIAIFSIHNNEVTNLKNGYLVYSHHNTGFLCVYDIQNAMEMKYEIEGYYDIQGVGKYYGGDFCCIGKNKKTCDKEILLFKNGTLEKSISILYDALFVVTHHNDIYFSTNENIYTINKQNEECLLIDNTCSIPFVSSCGFVAYLRNNTNLESETDYTQNTLCILKNGEIQEMGVIDQIVCWLSEEELLFTKTNIFVNNNNNKIQTIQYNSERIIIDVSTKEQKSTNLFDKTVLQTNLSEDSTKAICWYPVDGSTDMMRLGIYDIKNQRNYKHTIGTSSLNNISSVLLWLNENPMKNFSFTSSKENIGINAN